MPLPIVAVEQPAPQGDYPPRPPIDRHNAVMARMAHLASLEAQDAAARAWVGSPYASLRDLKPIPKSKTARSMLVSWLASIGIVATAHNAWGNTALILPGNRLAVVKCSMRWHEGSYRFQQIRDWEYEAALLLGISPEQAHLWIVPRAVLLAHSVPQHAAYSRMLTFPADAHPRWLRQYGGSLEEAEAILADAVPGSQADAVATFWSQRHLLPDGQRQPLAEGEPIARQDERSGLLHGDHTYRHKAVAPFAELHHRPPLVVDHLASIQQIEIDRQ